MDAPLTLFLISVSLCLSYALFNFLHKVLWQPLHTQRFLNSQGIKGPPYRFLIGNVKELIRFRSEALAKPMPDLSHDVSPRILPHVSIWAKEYGKNFVFWLGPRAQLVVSEPEMAKEALSNKVGSFPKSELYTTFHKKIFGQGLATSEGQKWAKIRKLANFALHGENLKGMIPEMVASVEMMLEKWKDCHEKELNVHEEFKILTSEIISRTAFGSSFQEGQQVFYMISRLLLLADRNMLSFRLPIISKVWRSRDEIEAERLEEGIVKSIMLMVKKREENAKSSGEVADGYGRDYLGLLLQGYHDDEDETKKISMVELIDECKTLYLAGQETTNSLLSWMILLLSIHQDWQDAARKEVVDLFGHDRTPDVDGIARLKIISMIISETLRLYTPVFSGFARETHTETTIGKLVVPPGVQIHFPFMTMHHDPEIWGEDVDAFKPDRFLEGIANATNNNPAAFMPFGAGPHACVGFNFATYEAKVALAMILQRYSFRVSPGYVHAPSNVSMVRPENGVHVILSSL
ncbi:unnamed protein product [Linum trigynum]|uniref:Cytochrome P450 n=1 Tax=Linum trigynum TaxID=586398 RepID=A0AAV2CUK6_9ROSI